MTEKKSLSIAEIESQAALELPNREVMTIALTVFNHATFNTSIASNYCPSVSKHESSSYSSCGALSIAAKKVHE